MPTYEFDLSDGTTVTVEAETEPTDEEVLTALQSQEVPVQEPRFTQNLGQVLSAPQPELPPQTIPYTGIPESMAPMVDWERFQAGPTFAEERTTGVPSAAGITPEVVPSGRAVSEVMQGIPATSLPFEPIRGILASEIPATLTSSVAKTGIGLAEYLSSMQGVTEFVGSMTPARLLVMAKWAVDMAKGAGQEAGALSALLGKPNKTRDDWQAISDHAVNTAAMVFGAGATARGVARPVTRALTPAKVKAAQELSRLLETTEPMGTVQPRQPIRQLGIPQAALTAEPFLQPGIQELAGQALREAQSPLTVPGRTPAIEMLRQELAPPEVVPVESRLAGRIPERGGTMVTPTLEGVQVQPRVLRSASDILLERFVGREPLPIPPEVGETVTKQTAPVTKAAQAAPKKVDEAVGLPPVKPGFVRMYHGGSDPTGNLAGPRDISQYFSYAKGYADKNKNPVWYVDVPADAPYMKKGFEEFEGGPKAPWINTVAPEEVMRQAKRVPEQEPLPIPPEVQAAGTPPTPPVTKAKVTPEKPAEIPKAEPPAKPEPTPPTAEDWQTTVRGRDVYKSDIAVENAKDDFVVAAMKSAPSYPRLLAAYNRFHRSLYGKSYDPKVIEQHPWDMLDASSGVMNAKSSTAKTLAALEDAVFKESGLPRRKASGRFRGGTGVNWDAVKVEAPPAEPPGAPREMRPSPYWLEDVTAPSVETVRAQRELENRQDASYLLEKLAEKRVRNVLEGKDFVEKIGKTPTIVKTSEFISALEKAGIEFPKNADGTVNYPKFAQWMKPIADKILPKWNRALESKSLPVESTLVKPTAAQRALEQRQAEAESAKTAISRGEKVSEPTEWLVSENAMGGMLYRPNQRVLHHGRGKAVADTEALQKLPNVSEVVEHDPKYVPNPQALGKQDFDQVVSNYVLNTLPPAVRRSAIIDIGSSMKPSVPGVDYAKKGGVAWITVRGGGDVIKGVTSEDGVVTSKGTWQRNYTPDQLIAELKPYFKNIRIVKGNTKSSKSTTAIVSDYIGPAREAGIVAPDLISKLESLKLPETGEGTSFSLPHPDAIKAIGRSTWNTAIDVAIASVKAGKAIAQAVEDAIAYLRKNVKGLDEAQARANLEYVAREETRPTTAPTPARSETPAEAIESTEATRPVVDPITGEPGKVITEAAAKRMEAKVKLPAQVDVEKLATQIDLFNKEIGDALETGGQFLPKEMRPEVAKGAPAERKTVTNKEINQYFVNKLSSIRKQMQATKQRIAQQADVESQVYFDTLQKRFETAFRQVQELRRASHEALYFWNKIRAEYQDIARAAGAMPQMKRQLPILDQVWKDVREGDYRQGGRHFIDFLRMNLFTLGSWTLDFGTNLVATTTKIPAWAIMDAASFVSGNPATRMMSATRALADNMKNWIPFGRRFRLPDQIESELGTTAGGEFGGKGREVIVDFSEILRTKPELADKLRHLDKLLGAPVRMKRAVDSFFGRFGATAELYNRAYQEGRTRGLKGDELKQFAEEYVQKPPDATIARAVKTGKELKFNRDLSRFEESFSSNLGIKVFVEAFPRWTMQFMRWGGEMVGVDPVFFKDLITGKATAEQTVTYLTKAATGWGGIYAFNQLFYDNIDANSMEYVKEDGDRVRLAGRTPAPELFFISALLRGDTQKAKAALAHLSLPGAKLLSGEPAGLISPLVDTIRESIRGRYTAEQTARELSNLVNNAIPGKSVLGLIRSLYDPTIRQGIGAPIPGVASLLPQRINPTTGEPLAPKQKIPGTKFEIPTVGGTPFPGATRVLNDIESALLNHGLGLTRPRRTSIIDLPAEDVPKKVRQEYEISVGKYVKEFVGGVITEPEFKSMEFEDRREVLKQLLEAARLNAKADLSDKYGTSMAPVPSLPLNIERMPERLRK